MGDIIIERRERVLVVTLNRPERKNAITRSMYTELNQALDQLDSDAGLRAAVIVGAGDAFTSGNDLQDFMNDPPVDASSPVVVFLNKLVELQKPLVAAVHGAAVGIGTTMLLHADLAYADDTAVFQMPFVKLGLVPEGGSSLLVPQLLGHRRASELLLIGEKFGPEVARELGFVNEVVENGGALERAMHGAQTLAKRAPEAMVASKQLMKAPYRDELLAVVRAEAQIFGERLQSPEAMEAFRAFFEKREPNFD